MFKAVIVILVGIWLAGLLLGGPSRLIADTRRLLELIIWAMLLMVGASVLARFSDDVGSKWLALALFVAWAGLTYVSSCFFVNKYCGAKKQSKNKR